MSPTECEYCRCSEVLTSSEAFVYFRCGTAYWPGTSQWTYANKCVETRAKTLEERIQRAVEVLEGAERFDVIPWDGGIRRDPAVDGWETDSGILDQLIEILKGNSPEFPDSSPVTADQLATDDYFEAVRQRVPWIVTIQHIEGLVEGYRQCGLMVWEVVEHIQRVCGGKHGKAD